MTLRVDGRDLEEYEDEDTDLTETDNGRTIVRYVESVPNANFPSSSVATHAFATRCTTYACAFYWMACKLSPAFRPARIT